MKKIQLEPNYNYTLAKGTSNWSDKVRDHTTYRLLTDEQIEWLFENIKNRFILDGHYIIFENDDDAMAFKLRWI